MNNIYLSKSRYCKCVQCKKIIWLKKYKPEFAVQTARESVLENGTKVGELAKGLFGKYEDIEFNEDLNIMIEKTQELLKNKKIIRNKLKINATINNSKIFKKIQNEYGTFYNYLKTFTNDKIIYEIDKTTNQLSDTLSKDLQKRGMKFVGSTIIYSYLQAIGVIYSHDKECFLYKENSIY